MVFAPLGVFPTRPGDPGGAFVCVERAFVERLSLSLYLQHGDDVPQHIPVVPEREFHSEVPLIDVPDRAYHRLMLRVYGSDPEVPASVRVQVVQRYYAHHGSTPFRLATRPPYAERFFGVPLTVGNDTLRLEITPLTEGVRVWAMVSVTNNTTQQVTLRVP